jgi:hypothetical protein
MLSIISRELRRGHGDRLRQGIQAGCPIAQLLAEVLPTHDAAALGRGRTLSDRRRRQGGGRSEVGKEGAG